MSSAARRFPVQGAAGTALDSSSSSLHLPSAASGDLHVSINTNPRPDYYLPHRAPVASHPPTARYSRPPQRIFDLRAPRPLHRNSGNDPSSQPVTTFGGAHPSAASFNHTSAWQSLPYPASVSCMQQSDSVDSTGTLSFGPVPAAGLEHRQDSLVAGSPWSGPPADWIMSQPSFGGPVEPFVQQLQQQQQQSHRGRRSHQRTPSASTIATAHSASPFEPHPVGGFPRIANAEFSPEAAALQAQFDAQFLNKSFPLDPSALLAPTPNHAYMTHPSNSAHQAMQAFAIDHHNADDREPDFTHSSRHSISTPDNASPATPPHGAPDVVEAPSVTVSTNDATPNGFRPPHTNLQLFRTESQAYQDELYNPPQETCTSTPAKKSTSTFLSPHQAVMSERLQAANDIRSQSPASVMSRERSPFREGVQLAYGGEWRSPGGMGTAAGLRRYQKEQAEQAEYARTRGQVQPEQTKTISPKDAQLELHDVDHPSLFQDSVPMGYKQHNTGVDAWTQDLVDGGDVSFGFQTPPVTTSFRQDMPVSNPAEAFNFVNLAHNTTFDASQLPNASFRSSAYPVTSIKTNPYLAQADAAPAFPATLTSMESSISDTGPSSSADDIATTVQRPADTRANTGTYTCTYHGCTQRFDSHANLQRHKREVHRSIHQHLSVEPQSSPHASSTASSGGATPSDASSRSTASPDPSAIGMTSAAIMARNSQAGPHKCTRINPSTGKPCNTIFSRPYDLTRHEDTIHNARKQKVRCPLCREEKTFSRNDALTRHMRVVHPEVESFGKRGRRD